jgi:hypothetical protein
VAKTRFRSILEEFERLADNPLTGEKFAARRRQVRHNLELPMNEAYSAFLKKLLNDV